MEAREIQVVRQDEKSAIESQLQVAGRSAVEFAKSLSIVNDEQNQKAADFLKEIKKRAKEIAEYWKGPKAAAQAAHKAVVEREKAMLEPLNEAEKIIKGNMVKYHQAVEKARMEAEAEAKRKQQEERDRLLAEAAQAEAEGRAADAMVGVAMAEMVEDMQAPDIGMNAQKVEGVGVRKSWKARIVDAGQVPAYVNGMEIRKIDLSALNQLARLSKGTAKVQGVQFYEEMGISARS